MFFIPTKIEYFIQAGGGVYIYIFDMFCLSRRWVINTETTKNTIYEKK